MSRGIRFVFIDAAVHYVDDRGEHSGLLSETVDDQEQRCRLQAVSNDKRWLRAAVALGTELIELERRSGSADAWGCASGHYGGASPGPNLMAHAIKAITGARPPKPVAGPLVRPERGRWAVHQVFSYDSGAAPSIAIWHVGFIQNPQFFLRWCEAITAGPRTPVLILPDSPILRDAARRWNAGERHRRGQTWQGDAIREYVGSAAYMRTCVSAAVEVDGRGISGDRLVAAVAFLRARHQLRVSPFDLLGDPLLAMQLGDVEAEEHAWSKGELAKLATLRKRYDLPQRIYRWLAEARKTPPVGIFSTGESYASSVEACLQTAEKAVNSGAIAPVLISSWTGWAPSALDRGERPEVPARSGTFGLLVDWYRRAFALAVRHGVIDQGWFNSREAWHAEAYSAFPRKPVDYYDHIYAAERALRSDVERRRLTAESDIPQWYRAVFDSAAKRGIAPTDETDGA